MKSKRKILSLALVVIGMLGIRKVKADFKLGLPVETNVTGEIPCLSTDGLELYYNTVGDSVDDDIEIWVTTRQTIKDDWGEHVHLDWPINTQYVDANPQLSFDGLALYFTSNRPGGYGNCDLWVTTRSAKDAPWDQPTNLGSPVNTWADEAYPSITEDGLELYFSEFLTYRDGGHGRSDIWVAKRPTKDDPWGEPANLGPLVNTADHDGKPSITPDGLIMFISCYERAGGYGGRDLWMSRRATREDEWSIPVNVGPLINTAAHEDLSYVSPDSSILYFNRFNLGTWQAPIQPIVDFNGDGIVDAEDMCIMVDNWGTNESLYDIGPMPWGDGIVDVEDLIIFAEHLFKEIPPAEEVE